jgi:hypothetical protein
MILPINFLKKQNGIHENLHIKWWIRLPEDIWIGPDGNKMEKHIKTAAIFFEYRDEKRKIPKKWSIEKVNTLANTDKWTLLSSNAKLKANDVLIFRFGSSVDRYTSLSGPDFSRAAFHAIRFHKTNVTSSLLSKMVERVRQIRKERHKFATTNMVAVGLEDVLRLMRSTC